MKKTLSFVLIMFYSLSSLTANEFKFKDKIINPACIKLMVPWISDYGVIIKQVVLDYCQDSNLAYDGKESYKNGATGFFDSDGEYFEYKVLGKLKNNSFFLHQTGNEIAKYKISKEELITDLILGKKSEITVLTKLSEDIFIPCYQSAKVENNSLIITKKVFDPNKPDASQCGDENEILILK